MFSFFVSACSMQDCSVGLCCSRASHALGCQRASKGDINRQLCAVEQWKSTGQHFNRPLIHSGDSHVHVTQFRVATNGNTCLTTHASQTAFGANNTRPKSPDTHHGVFLQNPIDNHIHCVRRRYQMGGAISPSRGRGRDVVRQRILVGKKHHTRHRWNLGLSANANAPPGRLGMATSRHTKPTCRTSPLTSSEDGVVSLCPAFPRENTCTRKNHAPPPNPRHPGTGLKNARHMARLGLHKLSKERLNLRRPPSRNLADQNHQPRSAMFP